ncbi:hypothetical protein NLI96_g7873 [Meripilus lineatus]|uniref:Glyoxylate reductase n=1 Tax=Meripilus lineatus TaxID=2056292 RepID=A0AAD5V095_9APHY|nr:hypothetical protein NLI96_g7873 [Physisporinus lineatus]
MSHSTSGHNSGKKFKLVVARDLGPDVMPILHSRPELDKIEPARDPGFLKMHKELLASSSCFLIGYDIPTSHRTGDHRIYTGLIPAGPDLKVISTMSVGYEHVDLDALGTRGIRLGYTPDVLTEAVADVTLMLALMAGRNVKETAALVDRGEWPKYTWSPFSFCGPQISSDWVRPTRTAGFIGFGRIAQATLARLIPFGITHCLYTSNPSSPRSSELEASILEKHPTLQVVERVDLLEVARQSDVVFVLAPGGEKTKYIVNEAFLKEMKKSAIIVNTSRGTLVDSDALAKALKEGWIWGAGLDVVDGEPNVDQDHPLVKEPRCVVLPHIGSATTETRLGMATLAAKNVLGGIFGENMPAELRLQSSK